MSRRHKPEAQLPLSRQLRDLLLSTWIPICLVLVILLFFFISYNRQYTAAFQNIADASQFNQNFKDDVDLKMYYYVIGSGYSDGLPINEVETAYALAETLSQRTSDSDSLKAIYSVRSLCNNLKERIYDIEATADYDSRMAQLESNVYILTELIQQYMYNYLYYEAGNLAQLQKALNSRLLLRMAVVFLGIAALIVLSLHQALVLCRNIIQPIHALGRRVERIGQGELSPQEPVQAKDPDLQVLSEGFEHMVARINRLMGENRREQERLRNMELALLQAQINPHFLYNTLDAIVWLIETEQNEKAVGMVTSLSSFFRSSLSRGQDVITLQEEEVHVRSYLEIQQVRYKDILQYTIDMDSAARSCRIPKLTLQPLVENALYHGIKAKRGMGTICVRSRAEDGLIRLEVTDTGAGMSPERLSQVRDSLSSEQPVGFGLATVFRRLQLQYGNRCQIRLDSELGQGTSVTIWIPSGPGEIGGKPCGISG